MRRRDFCYCRYGVGTALWLTARTLEFYRALKDRGKTAELVFYPREGHGFTEYYHQLDRMKREYAWITKYTLGADKVM